MQSRASECMYVCFIHIAPRCAFLFIINERTKLYSLGEVDDFQNI